MPNVKGRRGLAALNQSPSGSTNELLHLIFHELRTPLSSILGYASILLSGELGPLSQSQREVAERLRELARYLTSLITNLRQLALLTDKLTMIPWEPLDVVRLVRSVCHDLAVEAKRKGVRLTTQVPQSLPPLWAERDGLTQVLINLTMNAIKFTPPRGEVTVAAHATDTAIQLTVRDTGVGIAPTTIPKLFREFYHEDKPEVGAVGGTGFGLVIVKRIAARHHGTVSVSSRLGRGSTFRVTLPLRSGLEVIKVIVGQLIEQARSRRDHFSLLLIEASGSHTDRLERILKESIRGEDRYYPIEKGKLIAILAHTNLQGARVITDRVVQHLKRDPVLRRTRRLKVMLGMAAYPTHGRQPAQLLKVAHRQMVELPRAPAEA